MKLPTSMAQYLLCVNFTQLKRLTRSSVNFISLQEDLLARCLYQSASLSQLVVVLSDHVNTSAGCTALTDVHGTAVTAPVSVCVSSGDLDVGDNGPEVASVLDKSSQHDVRDVSNLVCQRSLREGWFKILLLI